MPESLKGAARVRKLQAQHERERLQKYWRKNQFERGHTPSNKILVTDRPAKQAGKTINDILDELDAPRRSYRRKRSKTIQLLQSAGFELSISKEMRDNPLYAHCNNAPEISPEMLAKLAQAAKRGAGQGPQFESEEARNMRLNMLASRAVAAWFARKRA